MLLRNQATIAQVITKPNVWLLNRWLELEKTTYAIFHSYRNFFYCYLWRFPFSSSSFFSRVIILLNSGEKERNTQTDLIRSSYLFFGRHTYVYVYVRDLPFVCKKATTRTISLFLSLLSFFFFFFSIFDANQTFVLNVCIGEWSKENLLVCVYHTLSRLDARMLMRKEKKKKDEGKRAETDIHRT